MGLRTSVSRARGRKEGGFEPALRSERPPCHAPGMTLDRVRIAAAILAPALPGCALFAEPPAPAIPQRPTLSSDTGTTKRGTFELEAGVTVDPGDLYDTPAQVKYGAGTHTELFLGWSPFVHLDAPARDATGPGDLFVGTRHRIVDEKEGVPSAALQLTTKLPTASESEGIGSGETDFFVAGMLTKGFGKLSATAFYQAGILGDPSGTGTILQHDAALAAGMPIVDHVGLFAELAGIFQPTTGLDAVFSTVGATYAISPSFVLDAAIQTGITPDAPDFRVLAGFTWNLGGPGAPGAK